MHIEAYLFVSYSCSILKILKSPIAKQIYFILFDQFFSFETVAISASASCLCHFTTFISQTFVFNFAAHKQPWQFTIDRTECEHPNHGLLANLHTYGSESTQQCMSLEQFVTNFHAHLHIPRKHNIEKILSVQKKVVMVCVIEGKTPV